MHFKQDRQYRFGELLLYGYRIEGEDARVSAFIMEEENGWEAEFLMPADAWSQVLESVFPDLYPKCAGARNLFFPDLTPDPPVWSADAVNWMYTGMHTEEDEMFGDETIYIFRLV